MNTREANRLKVVVNVLSHLLVLLTAFGMFFTQANANSDALPRVLALSDVLKMGMTDHPSLKVVDAKIAEEEAGRLTATWPTPVQLYLSPEGDAQQSNDTDQIALGDQNAVMELKTQIFEQRIARLEQERLHQKSQLRLQLMEAFFAVVVADYGYASMDEDMTLAFLRFNRARESMIAYEDVPEVEVRRLESIYLSVLAERNAASARRRSSRLALALAMNQPNGIIDQVVEPSLNGDPRPVPDYETTVDQVLKTAPDLVACRKRIEYLKTRLGVEKQSLNALVANIRDPSDASPDGVTIHYSKKLTETNTKASLAKLRGRLARLEAELVLKEHELRKQLMEHIQGIAYLDGKYRAAKAELIYREFELDKTRLQYEMEMRAGIGSANAEIARAMFELKKIEYQRVMAWERLDALTGQTP